MTVELDHLILAVNDRARSAVFYGDILGFTLEGDRGLFTVVRVNERLVIHLAPWGTKGGEHLAFALSEDAFESAFGKIRARGLSYGDAFDRIGNMQGPGEDVGAQGPSRAIYFYDLDHHLIGIRTYGAARGRREFKPRLVASA